VQQRAAEPQQGQRYGYDTKQAGGGKVHATNLRQQHRSDARGQAEAGDRQAQQAMQQKG
jgi:CspA family cold shock protein